MPVYSFRSLYGDRAAFRLEQTEPSCWTRSWVGLLFYGVSPINARF